MSHFVHDVEVTILGMILLTHENVGSWSYFWSGATGCILYLLHTCTWLIAVLHLLQMTWSKAMCS